MYSIFLYIDICCLFFEKHWKQKKYYLVISGIMSQFCSSCVLIFYYKNRNDILPVWCSWANTAPRAWWMWVRSLTQLLTCCMTLGLSFTCLYNCPVKNKNISTLLEMNVMPHLHVVLKIKWHFIEIILSNLALFLQWGNLRHYEDSWRCSPVYVLLMVTNGDLRSQRGSVKCNR